MSEKSPEEVDVDNVTDIDELKDYYRELQQRNAHLKGLIADDRQRLQQIEFKHRESVDEIAILRTQKEEITRQLNATRERNNTLNNNNNGNDNNMNEEDKEYSFDEFESDRSDDENGAEKLDTGRDATISQLKEEIEELQVALAEERMLGMQLDFSNRQSAQRADALQYQLAEEKLKNMELESTTQRLQATYSNSSHAGFVHLRGDSNMDQNQQDFNDLHNENKNDDDDSTSDLSKEFDLKIEEDEPAEVDDATEAKDLRHKLLEEQFKTEELKHRHRKSELQLLQYKEALTELRAKYNIDENKLDPAKRAYLDADYTYDSNGQHVKISDFNKNNNNNNDNNTNNSEQNRGLSEAQKEEYEAKIEGLRRELEIAKKKSQHLDKERRDSLNIMSKNFFAKQLQAARDTHSLEENMQEEINQLKDQIYDITKSKIKLLQSTHGTIEQLREHIIELSGRLRKHENWGADVTGLTPSGNDANIESVNVTDL